MLLGSVGELDSTQAAYHVHSLVTNQCSGCHMARQDAPGNPHPVATGHSFGVLSYDFCKTCHEMSQPMVAFFQSDTSNQIAEIKFDLDYWAANKAPPSLFAKYGNLSWEYTTPGPLSSGSSGPDAAEQALIPDNIKRARFNLYLVFQDGSLGVHNAPYCSQLLDSAETFISQELEP
jgi:hypothetical protein